MYHVFLDTKHNYIKCTFLIKHPWNLAKIEKLYENAFLTTSLCVAFQMCVLCFGNFLDFQKQKYFCSYTKDMYFLLIVTF